MVDPHQAGQQVNIGAAHPKKEMNQKPIVVGVNKNFDQNTIHLLSCCLTLTSKCPLQTFECSMMIQP